MTNKICIVLFAFLAIQGSALAGTIQNEFEDVLSEIQSEDLIEDGYYFEDQLSELLGGEVDALGDPQKCVPFIQEAYDTAVEVRRIITEARGLGKKTIDELIKCRALTDPAAKLKCRKDAVVNAGKQVKALIEAWKKIRPKITEVFEKFTKCLA